jgi:hypothetical protein
MPSSEDDPRRAAAEARLAELVARAKAFRDAHVGMDVAAGAGSLSGEQLKAEYALELIELNEQSGHHIDPIQVLADLEEFMEGRD